MHLFNSRPEQVHTYIGAFDHEVQLKLFPQHIQSAGHVVLLCVHNNQWLFTKHKQRGIEWPGGKVEANESPFQAAIRELYEETGAIPESIVLIGQYTVTDSEGGRFIKNIYVASVDKVVANSYSGEDTEGPYYCELSVQPNEEDGFSPLVCDGTFTYVRQAFFDLFG